MDTGRKIIVTIDLPKLPDALIKAKGNTKPINPEQWERMLRSTDCIRRISAMTYESWLINRV